MAGHGSRFANAGYKLPKPFIPVKGRPMVQVTCDSVQIPGRYIFCVQDEHMVQHSKDVFAFMAPSDKVVRISGVTEGAACTVLKAIKMIDEPFPLFIVNSDQYIEWDWFRFMNQVKREQADGGIVTFEGTGPKWSYARTAPDSNVVLEVAEKNPISTHATAGIYYWAKGSDFVKYAKQMIEKNVRVNNEFYVCPVYNEAIADGKKIIAFPCNKMLGMGTPDDLQENISKL
jgi:dTDP-glucose pyrophosphorylase